MSKNGIRAGKGAGSSVGEKSFRPTENSRDAGVAQLEHFLLSLQLDCSAHVHTYLMCGDRRYLGAAADRMLDVAAEIGCAPLDGLLLATPITADVEAVRDIIRKRNAEAEQLFASATDFHWSLFVTCADDPDEGRLLAMH
jgi:hypothetical protein